MKKRASYHTVGFKPSNFSPALASFYRNWARGLKRFVLKNEPSDEMMADYPRTMPAYAHDFGNYAARYGMGNYQIQFIIKFDGKLDFDMLSKAVRLSIDEEPVLGCRFVEHNPPYWKRLEDLDETMLCSLETTNDTEQAIQRFLESPLDMDHDPMVKVKLIRSDEYDTLGIKLNHTCCDGGGAKEYIHLLSRIYSSLYENGVYEPTLRIRSREDHKKALRTLGIKHPELDISLVEAPITVWPFPWKSGGDKNVTPFVMCRLPQGQLERLSTFGKKKGATINDLILTAFYRALFSLCKTPYGVPMDIGLTVDLRRYLPDNKADAIRNFSGGVITRLPRIKGETYEGTLSRVVQIMQHKKSQNPGYQSVTAAERAEMLNFHQALAYFRFLSKVAEIASQNCSFCTPGLSNLGILSKSLLKFGERIAADLYILPPVIRAPGILVVASSYNNILSLAAGYYQGAVEKRHVEKLLNTIKDELMKGCE